jgi:hypothetical protein
MSKRDDAHFTLKYISEQVTDGKDPLEEVTKEIIEIDKFLVEAEIKRLRRRNLQLVLNNLGGPVSKTRTSHTKTSEDVTDPENINLRNKILEVVTAANGPIKNRDLINLVMQSAEKAEFYDQEPWILRTVKSLGEKEILSRDSENRIIKGPNFC